MRLFARNVALRSGAKIFNAPRSIYQMRAISSTSGKQDGGLKNIKSPVFFSGENNVYADQMYVEWKNDPSSVHPSWRALFENAENGEFSFQDPLPKLAENSGNNSIQNLLKGLASMNTTDHTVATANVNLVHLIRAYQTSGHLKAKIDPLGLMAKPDTTVLKLDTYGFTEADMDKEFDLSGFDGISGYLSLNKKISLRDLVKALEITYCQSIGVEYMHIMDREKCNFIREKFEVGKPINDVVSKEDKIHILDRLTYAVELEAFFARKWNTAKRFGLEGCESMIPGFKALIDTSTKEGVESIFIGMPHRGRLNVLANVMRKDLAVMFREFEGTMIDAQKVHQSLEEAYALSGDVKYHLGASRSRRYPDGRKVRLSLAANPSHLEAVDPVVVGRTRAKQYFDGDSNSDKSMAVIMHGDAAFCGQGVVYETMHMGALEHYKTGGTIHIVVNNQIGFTTDPKHSRSTRYCTDIGKGFDCPIFHVNADDPVSCAYVFQVAAEYRQKFKSDVIVDVIGYRQMGHNEMDQPFFTQPEMYSVIKKRPNVLKLFQKKLLDSGEVDEATVKEISTRITDIFEAAYKESKEEGGKEESWQESVKWKDLVFFGGTTVPKKTSVDKEILVQLGVKANTPPDDFSPHPTIKRMLKQRVEKVESGKNLDWALGEQLAYASLLNENIHVRISGQDAQRGTFAHRHAVIHDQKTFEMWTGLNNIFPENEITEGKKQRFIASNSSLSEFGVMGFELGYSLEDPNALVIWEAQFGDFVNGAQTIIDEFLSSSEQKWRRQCGLVLLLPHGYDGQGPDHSSCRIERFLQMSDEDPDHVPDNLDDKTKSRQVQDSNWQIVNCTTPAQIFHVLRRQIHRDFRKPLIVASPKSILRTCTSDIEEFCGEKAAFQRLIPEVNSNVSENAEKVRKLIFCSGKIYYELEAERAKREDDTVAIVRIEQIMPFPFDCVGEQVKKYKNAELLFVQEEPKNMGTWYYCDDRIYTSIRHYLGEERRCRYVGRHTMSSPAVGYASVHNLEQKQIINTALE